MLIFLCHDKKCSLHSGICAALAGCFGGWRNSPHFCKQWKSVVQDLRSYELGKGSFTLPELEMLLRSARLRSSCCLGQPDFCSSTAVVQHHVRLFYFFKYFKLLQHGNPKYEAEWQGSSKYFPLPCKANKAFISLPINMRIVNQLWWKRVMFRT